ncbi:glycosyltransferase family 29 protein [bacterium]|nr:glycosyltransferase family 29 protein [bacterium]
MPGGLNEMRQVNEFNVRELFIQGRWNTTLVESALSNSTALGRSRDWIDYLDIRESIHGISSMDWTRLADYYFSSAHRSPELLFKLINLVLAPGHMRDVTQDDLSACYSTMIHLPNAHFRRGLFESLHSGFMGKCVTHYPHLLANKIPSKVSTVFFSRQSEKHRNCASRLLSLKTSIDEMLSKILESNKKMYSGQTSVRVAVVGNSPIILKQNNGADIDDADVVIRFNHLSLNEKTYRHTGTRTDLWVISPSTPTRLCPSDAQGVVVTGLNALQRPSLYWRQLPELALPLIQLPSNIWYELVKLFQAPPSAGALLLASLEDMPVNLDIHCYGFTSSNEDITCLANHYNDDTPRSARHNWQAETKWINAFIKRSVYGV